MKAGKPKAPNSNTRIPIILSSDANTIRAVLTKSKIKAVIPVRSNRRVIEHDRKLYKQRNRAKRMSGHLKINRTITTRYD